MQYDVVDWGNVKPQHLPNMLRLAFHQIGTRRIFDIKDLDKWVHSNVEFFKEEPWDVTILTPEKEVELINELESKKIKVVVITVLNAGMRKKEIVDLRKDNVAINKRMIHVTHTLNWEIRDITMNERLTKTLKEVID